ncbi:methylsterol monooxygenase 1-1-like [Herrania umbratica]|uniref:Methylsterol monooxygenase 1-1-like n=1 Tax=Herrania umbratica TaxID=108875 RepID=A0A6J0ZZN7_9ROSI|nr:methylsterol monooxygenase 1-1-like [Herrania umbratica]
MHYFQAPNRILNTIFFIILVFFSHPIYTPTYYFPLYNLYIKVPRRQKTEKMLPYQTLDEAALVLERNLTLAEKLWYNYSADKSDFLLYSHNIFFLCLVFSLAPLPYAFIELSKSEDMAKFKVQTKINRSFSDMFKCYKAVMKKFIVVVGPLQIVSFPTVKWVGIHTSLPLPSFWEVSSQLVVYFLIEDYTNYWLHRLLHSKWGYEKIHYVHHEYSAPIGFAAPYAHWAEILILGIPTFLGPLMIPCHIITLCLWTILRHVEAIQTHSGYEFPWSPTKFIPFYVGAEYHDYHHYVGGQSQSNFASVFTYCDRIYGTDRGYHHHKQALNKLKGM